MTKLIKNKIVYEENINNINSKANSIVFPDDMQELSNLVRLSALDIVPRGNGSSFTGGVIPRNSVIVDLSKLNKILDINVLKKTVLVEAGCLLSDLNEALEEYELELPIDPLFLGLETIGGMIAKNSSGSRELKYGRMSNWLDSIEIINARGEQVRIPKSELSDFFGMEGTTGIIVLAMLRLTSRKKRTLTILKSDKLEGAIGINNRLRLDPEVCSIDLLSPIIASLMGFERKYHLFVELESNKGNFKGEEYIKYMKLKSRVYKRVASEGLSFIENFKISLDSIPDIILFMDDNNIPYFGHISSGVFYCYLRRLDKEKINNLLNFAKKLRTRMAWSFGVGITRKEFIEVGEADLLKRVKKRQDPNIKFNKGKLVDLSKKERTEEIIKEIVDAEVITEEIIEDNGEIGGRIIETNPGEYSNVIANLDKDKSEEQAEQNIVEDNNDIQDSILEKNNTPEKDINEIPTMEKEDNLSEEEREKIRKIASGLFTGGKKE